MGRLFLQTQLQPGESLWQTGQLHFHLPRISGISHSFFYQQKVGAFKTEAAMMERMDSEAEDENLDHTKDLAQKKAMVGRGHGEENIGFWRWMAFCTMIQVSYTVLSYHFNIISIYFNQPTRSNKSRRQSALFSGEVGDPGQAPQGLQEQVCCFERRLGAFEIGRFRLRVGSIFIDLLRSS